MEIKENLEGKKTDNLEATSASETTNVEEPVAEGEPAPELNNSTVPTEEEVKDASLDVAPEEVAPAPESSEPSATVESDQPVVEENVESEPVPSEPVQVHEENGVTEMPALKTFTQSQVNEMVGNTRTETREKTFRYIYDRYGVEDEAGLDELIGNAQRYDSLQEQYNADKKNWKDQSSLRDKELADVKEQVALMQSGIDNGRYEDAKFILRGKGLEITAENIANELATHPEWKKMEQINPNFSKVEQGSINSQPAEPESKISVLGNEGTTKNGSDEEDFVLGRMFKV